MTKVTQGTKVLIVLTDKEKITDKYKIKRKTRND